MNPKLLDEIHRDLCDGIRNEAAITEADLIAMAKPESLGTIEPTTKAVFLAAVAVEHGRSDFLEVLADGTVQVPARYGQLEPTEANAIRTYVAAHNLWWARGRKSARELYARWEQRQRARDKQRAKQSA